MQNLNEEIIDYFEMEERVCSALAPYVTRYREGDFPFINGKRVDFEVLGCFPWEKWGDNLYPLCRMSDIANQFYRCMLVPYRKRRFLLIDSYVKIERVTAHKDLCGPEFEPVQVTAWSEVVNAVATKVSLPAVNYRLGQQPLGFGNDQITQV